MPATHPDAHGRRAPTVEEEFAQVIGSQRSRYLLERFRKEIIAEVQATLREEIRITYQNHRDGWTK